MFKLFLLLSAAAAILAFSSDEVCHEPTTTKPPCTTTPSCTTTPPTRFCPVIPVRTCQASPQTKEMINCNYTGTGLKLDTFSFGTYYYDSVYRPWCEAHQFCLDHNMVLAHPLNKTHVREFQKKYGKGVHHAWVGGQNLDTAPGDYRWLDRKSIPRNIWFDVMRNGQCAVLCIYNVLHTVDCKANSPGLLCQVPTCCT